MTKNLENLTIDSTSTKYPIASALTVASDTFLQGESALINWSQIQGGGFQRNHLPMPKKLWPQGQQRVFHVV